MVELRVKVAWKENLLRQLGQSRTLSGSARFLNIGIAKITQECRRDPAFKQQIEDALGRPVDSIASSVV